MAKIKPLQQSSIFATLSDRELALFSRIVSEEDYIRGTVLVAENMKSDRFFMIEKGEVAVRIGEQDGVEGHQTGEEEGGSL